MSRPSLEDATVLVAACLYDDGSKFSGHPLLFRDLVRGVARVYGLPSQSPTQMVNESRLCEGKMVRPDGRGISFEGEKTISLEEVVKRSVISLEKSKEVQVHRGVGDNNALHQDDRLKLTESGLLRANRVYQLQVAVDLTIRSRIQWPDPNKTPRHDERLTRLVRSIGDKFPSGNPVSEHEADARWVQHLGATKEVHDRVLKGAFSRSPSRPPEHTPGGNMPTPRSPSPAPSRGPNPAPSTAPSTTAPEGPRTRWDGLDP